MRLAIQPPPTGRRHLLCRSVPRSTETHGRPEPRNPGLNVGRALDVVQTGPVYWARIDEFTHVVTGEDLARSTVVVIWSIPLHRCHTSCRHRPVCLSRRP